jgi:hypothetical protein
MWGRARALVLTAGAGRGSPGAPPHRRAVVVLPSRAVSSRPGADSECGAWVTWCASTPSGRGRSPLSRCILSTCLLISSQLWVLLSPAWVRPAACQRPLTRCSPFRSHRTVSAVRGKPNGRPNPNPASAPSASSALSRPCSSTASMLSRSSPTTLSSLYHSTPSSCSSRGEMCGSGCSLCAGSFRTICEAHTHFSQSFINTSAHAARSQRIRLRGART